VDTPDLPADQRKTFASTLDEAAHEAEAIERELQAVHREIQLGRDIAGIGDTSVVAAAAARAQVRAAQDAEHRALAGIAATSRNRERSQQLVAIGDRAGRLAEQLASTLRQIDGVVDQGLQEIRGTIRQERATLAAYKTELAGHEAESRSIGATVLAARFKDVKAKFYDIVIRTDVGNVDVSWSQKEDTDDDLKRLNLSRQRELKQLRDEFKDILDAATPNPSSPAKKPAAPAPEPAPFGSPDKATPGQRIAPVERAGAPAAPTVRPDAKPAAKTTPRKGGGQ